MLVYQIEKTKHFELLSFLHNRWPQEMVIVMDRLNKMNEGVLVTIVEDIQSGIMSDLDKEWVVRLLLYRKKWIMNWYEGRVRV